MEQRERIRAKDRERKAALKRRRSDEENEIEGERVIDNNIYILCSLWPISLLQCT